MKQGKYLEMVVDCLQRLLAPDGFHFTRNKKYYQDRMLIGEVDVLMQGHLNSQDMVIAIECRDRKGRQDRPWIREIIGKKVDLARFGITHWMAVSQDGFTKAAEKLAVEAGIILIVPGKAEPVEPEKPGPHHWMEWSMKDHRRLTGEFKADVEHESDNVLDIIQETMKLGKLDSILVVTAEATTVTLAEIVDKEIQTYCDSNLSDAKEGVTHHTIVIDNLQCVMNEVDFKIKHMEVGFSIETVTLKPDFRIVCFVIPQSMQILGMIGINKYDYCGRIAYLMIGVKPGDLDNPIMVFRDAEGNPMPNMKVTFSIPRYPPNVPVRRVNFRSR